MVSTVMGARPISNQTLVKRIKTSSGTAGLPVQGFSRISHDSCLHTFHILEVQCFAERQKLHGWRLLTEFSPLLNGTLSGIPTSS
ncbi:uncharacterized [Tachysurus ichikawai]